MQYVDFILIVMYLAMTSAVVAIIWSKLRPCPWWKLALNVVIFLALVLGVAWRLPWLMEEGAGSQVWTYVADVFLLLIGLFLLAAVASVVWSIVRRR